MTDLSHASALALAASFVDCFPALAKNPSLPSSLLDAMKLVLRLFLPVDTKVCLALLKRHFREKSIEVLSELVLTCPQAIDLIVHIALQSGKSNGVLQATARVIISLGSGVKGVRAQGIAAIAAILKGKSQIEAEIPIKVAESPCFAQCESEVSVANNLLSRVSKHRAGILSDANYLPVVLSKVAGLGDFQLLASCVADLKLQKSALLLALGLTKSEELTDLLVQTELNQAESVVVMRRFQHYQRWSDFNRFDWLLAQWNDLISTKILLEVVTNDVFSQLSKANQEEFLLKSLTFLCEAKCGEASADVHARLGEIGLTVELVHGVFERKVGVGVLEKLLTVVQDVFKEPEPIILSDLFAVLSTLSACAPSAPTEFLKQLTLTCIRLHYPAVLQVPALLSTHISLLVSCVVEGDEYALQTKAHMYSTLAGCCHMFPTEVANQLKESFRSSTLKHGKLELNIMKKTVEQVATSLLAHRVSLTGILIAVIEGANTAEGEFAALMSDVLAKVGAKYLTVCLLHMLGIGMGEGGCWKCWLYAQFWRVWKGWGGWLLC